MPAFGSLNYTQSLMPGQAVFAFVAEQPAPGTTSASASLPFAIVQGRTGSGVGIAIDLSFSGAPGVFEVDVLAADNLSGALAFSGFSLVAGGNITTVDANNNAHLELPNFTAQFICLLVKARTNAVNLTAVIRRD